MYQATESKIGFILVDDSCAMVNVKELLGNKHIIAFPVSFEQYSKKDLVSILVQKTQSMFKGTKLSQREREKVIQFLVNMLSVSESRRIDFFLQYLVMLIPDLVSKAKRIPHNQLIMELQSRLTKSQHLTLDFMSRTSLTAEYKSEPKEPDLPYA